MTFYDAHLLRLEYAQMGTVEIVEGAEEICMLVRFGESGWMERMEHANINLNLSGLIEYISKCLPQWAKTTTIHP